MKIKVHIPSCNKESFWLSIARTILKVLMVICTSKVATDSFWRKVQEDKQSVKARRGLRAVLAMGKRKDYTQQSL